MRGLRAPATPRGAVPRAHTGSAILPACTPQTLRDPSFPHQYAVDAYAAQHASDDSPPIRTAFALIGLCLAVERRLSGRDVQLAHMRLAKTRRDWPRFIRRIRAPLTVADALAGGPLKEWAAAVWAAWSEDHERVRALL